MTIEATVINWFNTQNLGVTAYGGVPADRPNRFVTVERTGGAVTTFRDFPTLAVQTWAQSAAAAAALADTIRHALPGLTSVEQIARVEIGSTYNWPDPLSGQPRYQTILTLTVKWNDSKE